MGNNNSNDNNIDKNRRSVTNSHNSDNSIATSTASSNTAVESNSRFNTRRTKLKYISRYNCNNSKIKHQINNQIICSQLIKEWTLTLFRDDSFTLLEKTDLLLYLEDDITHSYIDTISEIAYYGDAQSIRLCDMSQELVTKPALLSPKRIPPTYKEEIRCRADSLSPPEEKDVFRYISKLIRSHFSLERARYRGTFTLETMTPTYLQLKGARVEFKLKRPEIDSFPVDYILKYSNIDLNNKDVIEKQPIPYTVFHKLQDHKLIWSDWCNYGMIEADMPLLDELFDVEIPHHLVNIIESYMMDINNNDYNEIEEKHSINVVENKKNPTDADYKATCGSFHMRIQLNISSGTAKLDYLPLRFNANGDIQVDNEPYHVKLKIAERNEFD